MTTKDWKRDFFLIKLLRKDREAPIDFCGPKSISDRNSPLKVYRYHILCALQLSSMTKDQKTHDAMLELRNHGLSVENIAKTDSSTLENLIKDVGFYRKKAIYMKQTAQILLEKHGGEVPKDVNALMELPGIGPKMAYLTLSEAFDEHVGIGVDSHVHKISNLLGWVKTKNPEDTRVKLESFVPKEEWGSINYEIVGLGQMIQQPEYRLKLAKTLIELEDEHYVPALSLVKKLGFDENSLKKKNDQLFQQIQEKFSSLRPQRKKLKPS